MTNDATNSGSQNHSRVPEEFQGFEPLTANFLYCPNQLFDVCLPHYSRGVVRLVCFMLRKTLGWLDQDGNPIQQDIKVSYLDLIARAGVSRGAARKAIEEAIAGGFIRRTRQGKASSRGVTQQASSFELCWDERSDYVKNPKTFRGFYTGEGHRTPIPNAFFDRVVPQEPLAVVKVVGTVLRHTIGYVNQFGTGRRMQARLPYTYIQKYTNLRHRGTLSETLERAIKCGYIRLVSTGFFDPRGGRRSRPATYAVNWLSDAVACPTGSKNEPAGEQSKNRTETSSITGPANRSKNRTDRKTSPKDTCKQQHVAVQILQDVGFDERTAKQLAATKPLSEIKQQIAWIDKRQPDSNRLGMLRRSIEEGWAPPATIKLREKEAASRNRHRQLEAQVIAEERRRTATLNERRKQWFSLPSDVRDELRQTAINNAYPAVKRWLEEQPPDRPVSAFLLEMEKSMSTDTPCQPSPQGRSPTQKPHNPAGRDSQEERVDETTPCNGS